MGIQEFLKRFKEDSEFAMKFKGIVKFEDLLKAANEEGYSITKEEVLELVGKEKDGEISDEDMKLTYCGGPYGSATTGCTAGCSSKCTQPY